MKAITLLIWLLAFLSISLVQPSSAQTKSDLTAAERREVAGILLESAKNLNANLPVMVDAETRWDTAIAVGMDVVYKFTLVNKSVNLLDKEQFKNQQLALLLKSAQSDKNILLMLEVGAKFHYTYFDKDGALIAQVRVDRTLIK